MDEAQKYMYTLAVCNVTIVGSSLIYSIMKDHNCFGYLAEKIIRYTTLTALFIYLLYIIFSGISILLSGGFK